MCIHWADAVKRIGAAAVASMFALGVVHAQGYPSKFEFGEPASEQEIAAIAIAISVDGKGLPSGQGDYARGKQVYETACAACHGADLMGVANIPNMPAGASLLHARQGLRVEHSRFVDDLSFAKDVGAHGVDFVCGQRSGCRGPR